LDPAVINKSVVFQWFQLAQAGQLTKKKLNIKITNCYYAKFQSKKARMIPRSVSWLVCCGFLVLFASE
jgi:hypothetical protein